MVYLKVYFANILHMTIKNGCSVPWGVYLTN